MHEYNANWLVEAPFTAQRGTEHGLLMCLVGPLNCIGYWAIEIYIFIIHICEAALQKSTLKLIFDDMIFHCKSLIIIGMCICALN